MKVAILACGLSIALFACSTESSRDMIYDPPPVVDSDEALNEEIASASFTLVQTKIFDAFCAMSYCRGDVSYPNLTPERSYNIIVDGASSSPDQPLIKPGDPDNSYLYLKISNGEDISGRQMPPAAPPLNPELIAALRNWIERGAPND